MSNTENLNTQVLNVKTFIRLDRYCLSLLPALTRSQLKNGIKLLTVNGRKAKLAKNVKNGDVISLVWESCIPDGLEPENLPLKIIYEDENVIAVNKQAGMVTHPASGNWSGTLVNALLFYRLFNSPLTDEFAEAFKSENTSGDFFRAGIVHRLDKDTSGVIITARNKKTEDFLKEQFKKRKIKKIYIALLNGIPKEKSGKIKTSVFRSKGNRTKFTACADLTKGKKAVSAYKVLKVYGNYSLAVFRIFTGRTHQIRLHAKFIGCPVAGDSVYGKKSSGLKAAGLMLHSYKLSVRLPDKKSALVLKAPLPARFRSALKFLNGQTALKKGSTK